MNLLTHSLAIRKALVVLGSSRVRTIVVFN